MLPKKGRRDITVDGVLYHYKISGYVYVVIQNTETNEIFHWGEEVKPKWNTQITPSLLEEIIKAHYAVDVVIPKLTNCTDCIHHYVTADPDPTDRFNDDDAKVVCKLSDRNITVACRPYNVRKESDMPTWCPMLNNQFNY